MVHFIQLLNNSDTWDVCFPNMEPGLAPEKNAEQYHVFVKWVFDSEEYNDRMNEEDFELDEQGRPNNMCAVHLFYRAKPFHL